MSAEPKGRKRRRIPKAKRSLADISPSKRFEIAAKLERAGPGGLTALPAHGELTRREANDYMREYQRNHHAWLATPLSRKDWFDLLMACQSRQVSCRLVAEKIEADIGRVVDALTDLQAKVVSGYDFRADPDGVMDRLGVSARLQSARAGRRSGFASD